MPWHPQCYGPLGGMEPSVTRSPWLHGAVGDMESLVAQSMARSSWWHGALIGAELLMTQSPWWHETLGETELSVTWRPQWLFAGCRELAAAPSIALLPGWLPWQSLTAISSAVSSRSLWPGAGCLPQAELHAWGTAGSSCTSVQAGNP